MEEAEKEKKSSRRRMSDGEKEAIKRGIKKKEGDR